MVDALASGASDHFDHGGSSPLIRTKHKQLVSMLFWLTMRYNFCYTLVMKTAISIPNDVYESAEKLANSLGKSRSQLYTQALSGYVAKHKKDNVTSKLDEV